jgi:plastocyanin
MFDPIRFAAGARRFVRRLCAATVVACAAATYACGSGGPSAPDNGATVTITSSGVSPTQVRVAVGSRVTFVNNDIRPHAMSSDPISTHTDCPAINDVGTLAPGQSRATGTLDVARSCGFHDHTNELDPTFKGSIIIQ